MKEENRDLLILFKDVFEHLRDLSYPTLGPDGSDQYPHIVRLIAKDCLREIESRRKDE
jgi:hypothetical protein